MWPIIPFVPKCQRAAMNSVAGGSFCSIARRPPAKPLRVRERRREHGHTGQRGDEESRARLHGHHYAFLPA